MRPERLDGRTAIVTGANGGLGFEAARELARRGASVILACRNERLAGEAAAAIAREHPAATVRSALLDLADLRSVHRFAEAVLPEKRSLDLLINNAGVMMGPRGRTTDGFELQFGTNHLGHFALTALLLPGILRSPGSRVVTVSSSFHKRGRIDFENLNAERSFDSKAAYAQSKLANILFSNELQRRFERAGAAATSVSVHPGAANTGLQRHTPLLRVLNGVFATSPARAALPLIYAATSPDLRGGEYVGPGDRFEIRGAPTPLRPAPLALDADLARELWSASEALTGISTEL